MRKAGISERLASSWYASNRPSRLLRPLTWLYRAVVAMRVGCYRRGWLAASRVGRPVVVVGNITVGGTGKTPLVIALVQALRERGWHPGVVSRGYGGSQREPELVPADPNPARFGDEPSLIRQATRVLVAVGRDRAAAADLLMISGCDVIVADDGLQHYALARDLEICVIDGERRFGNGLMLPSGPLREPLSRLQHVDFRVCNGGTAEPGETAMRLVDEDAVNVRDRSRTRPLADFSGQAVHAVAGIGNPERFFASLRACGIEVTAHAFPDHHRFAARDLDFGDGRPVLMTAKDAIKCLDVAPPDCWYVPVQAVLPPDFFDAIDARLRSGGSTP